MLSIDIAGRCGNQLFQYAMVRSIAERRGFNFWINQDNWQAHNLFNLDFGVADGTIQQIYGEGEFDEKIFDVPDFTGFNGYFQNEKYFDHDKARSWFKPLFSVLLDYESTCYIHFRGGDYNVYPWNMYQLKQ